MNNQFFINNILYKNIYENQPSLNTKGLFEYNINKEILNYEKDNDNDKDKDYEIINDIELDENEEKEKEEYIKNINDEIKRVNSIIEYLIVNLNINKIIIPDYKIYNYDNLAKNLRTKVKKSNHIFDIKLFLLKNKITKDNTETIIKDFLNINDINFNLSESKQMIFFILNKIVHIYNLYNKSMLYSLKLLEENPNLIKNKDNNSYMYLVNINKDFFNINETKTTISINHFNIINNAFNKDDNKSTTKIVINKDKDNFIICFK
jgi:hypothetical protein